MTTCPRCGETKPEDEFWRDRRTKSGLAVYCKTCGTRRNADKYRARAAGEARETRPWRPLREDLPDGMSRCRRCGRVRPQADFVVASRKARGIGSYCLASNAANSTESRNRLHGSASSYHLKARYGITAADREEMRAAQGGVCLICSNAPADHVDHDHATGAIRGMLCFNCNGGLGQFEDDPDVVARALQYLLGELVAPYLPEADAVYSEVPLSVDGTITGEDG